MTTRFSLIHRAVCTDSEGFSDSFVVKVLDVVGCAVFEAQSCLVQLELVEKVEVRAHPRRVPQNDILHALLFQIVCLVVEAVLFAEAGQRLID